MASAPKSGNYKIESIRNGHALGISINWVSLENQAFYSQYEMIPDDVQRPIDNPDLADSIKASILNASTIQCTFFKAEQAILVVTHEILQNGYLKVTHQGENEQGQTLLQY